jgi:hypothetical protein|tara:strand:+ start:2984 stop:4069 length:1086 start_codon:yes stop_codon:yes gene_type:complete
MNDFIKTSDYLQGRLISTTKDLSISKIERQIIMDMFEEHPDLAVFENVDELTLIDKNFFYDLYKFKSNKKYYVLKYGDEDEYRIFKREAEVLKKIGPKNLSPQLISYGQGDDFSFLVTSFEHSVPIREYGTSALLNSLKVIASNLSYLHENTQNEFDETEIFIDAVFSYSDFEVVLDEETMNSLNNIDGFKESLEILKRIKHFVKIQLEHFKSDKNCLCSLNLSQSTILFRDGMIKFCNFHESFNLNPIWDLAFFSFQSELSKYPKKEFEFLEHYSKHFPEIGTADQLKSAIVPYKQVASKLILYKLICVYYYMYILPEINSSHFQAFFIYESIRDFIQNEFYYCTPILDKMFGFSTLDLQ